jgi:Putative transposase
MSDVAWHLEREVIGHVPTRQYVCSLPWRWRLRAGYAPGVCSALLRAFTRALDITIRERVASVTSIPAGELETGMCSVVQRTDSALRLNVHFHVLALDGAYDAHHVFHTLSSPSATDLEALAATTVRLAQEYLRWLGRDLEGPAEQDERDPSALETCYAGQPRA